MNKKIERIITIGLASALVAYFCYQVAYGFKETCPGLMDGSKCLTMDNTAGFLLLEHNTETSSNLDVYPLTPTL